MQKEIKITKSKFVRVKCPKCENEQIIFGKAVTRVRCLKCKTQLTKPTGGKAKIRAKVLEVLK
ncbi:MAG: 30S ribosomal protein S27e [Candidatus Pacearchaeota archaeon]|nr:30S ribosomal protein S27e [Candidatus Pacearchaeota archaeon]